MIKNAHLRKYGGNPSLIAKNWLVPALICYSAVMLIPIALAQFAWSWRGLLGNACWILNKADTNQYSLYKIVSNIVVAPAIEALPICIVHRHFKKNAIKIPLIFLYGFIIHGISVYSFGKALAFVAMYVFASRDAKKMSDLFINLFVIHSLWNIAASGVGALKIYGVCKSGI